MKGPRISRLWPTLASLALAAGLAACSSGSTGSGAATASGGPELHDITVGVPPTVDGVTAQIAKDKGFFKQEGLNVKFVTLPSSNAGATALLSHTSDFVIEDYIGMMKQEQSVPNLNLRVVADNSQGSSNGAGLMVAKNSKITSLSQLAGKKVGFPSPGVGLASLATDVLMQPYHLTTKDFTTVVVSLPNAAQSISVGTVDAVFAVEPFVTLMEEKSGARMLVDLQSGPMSGFPATCWATDAAFVQKYPKTVAAYQAAMQKATQLAATDPALVRQEVPKLIPSISPQLAKVIALPVFNSTLTLARLQRVVNVMIRLGDLPASFSSQVKAMYDPPRTSG